MSKEEIESLLNDHKNDPRSRKAQKALAFSVTSLVHGEDQARLAESITDYLTNEKDIAEANEQELESVRKEIPSIKF